MPDRHSFARAERLPVLVGGASIPMAAVSSAMTETDAADEPNAEDGEPNSRMSQPPELTSPLLPASPAHGPEPALGIATGQPAGREPDHHRPQRIPRWLERSELFLRVLLRMYIGLAVCVAPWWPLFWDQNPLFMQFPTLSVIAANGAIRGVVSGLGLLNLWIAFRDAIRAREE